MSLALLIASCHPGQRIRLVPGNVDLGSRRGSEI